MVVTSFFSANKDVLASLGAGTIAGASGIFVGHPFDTLKTRLQCGIQISGVANDFNFSSVKQLYRGVLPPLLTAGAMQSVNFSLYEYFKETALSRFDKPGNGSNSSSSSRQMFLPSVFVGGFISGAMSSVVSSPVSFIKVRQQLATRAGMIDCIRHVYRLGGLKTFYRGYPVILAADSFGRGVYLLTYESSKYGLLATQLRFHFQFLGSNSSNSPSIDSSETLVIRMIAAACAGCFSWLVCYPLDVVKSRMQLDMNKEKYKNCMECFVKTWQEGGMRAMYRGIGFTLIRAAPVAATILPVYEYTKEFIARYE